MARETKVGLLAGLAFIICFAVILANRGGNGPPGLSDSFLPAIGEGLPKLVHRNQTSDAARGQVRTPAGNTVAPEQPATRPENRQAAVNPLESAPPSGAQIPVASNPTPALHIPVSGVAQNTRPIEVSMAPSQGLERALTSRPAAETGLHQLINPTASLAPAQEPPVIPTWPAPGELGAPAPQQTSAAALGTAYVVKPSDTLSKIAAIHYGTKSQQAIDAIFEANRKVLTDINSVKAGMTLIIPQWGKPAEPMATIRSPESGATQPGGGPNPDAKNVSEPATETKTASRQKPAPKKGSEAVALADKGTSKKGKEGAASAKDFRWYQVKKDDRFASIAREQLGDTNRWQELYELNKDKFPDPQKIREGVRIKLPVAPTLSATKERKN